LFCGVVVYLSQFSIEAMSEYTYARVTVTKEAAGYDIDDDTAESLRELVVADYIVFLLALDTYMRYLKTAHDLKTLTEGGEEDDVLQEGIRLIRYAERVNLEDIVKEMRTSITSQAAQNLLDAAIRPQPTAKGIMVRALKLRTMLSRNYVAMTKAIFGVSMKARQTAREAIEASAMEDPDSALAKLASLTLRNKRLEQWVDKASEIVVTPGLVPLNPVKEATKGSTDGTTSLLVSRVKEEGTSAATEEASQHSDAQGETLSRIEGEAVETAKKTLAKSGEEDKPVTRSEAIGIATAAATAIASDPADMKNVPASFINNGRPLDPEQMAAALTDGRVLVAAGAGAGKSTTLISRIAYLVNEKGVYPTKILACSFNRKAADELKAKLSAKVGPGTADNVAVDTMHALFARMIMGDGKSIPGFGTPEEKSMIRDRLIAPTGKGRRGISPVSVTMTIRSIWKECDPEKLAAMAGGGALPKWFTSPPKAKQMNLYINQWQGNDVTLEQARASASSQTEAQAVVWFEMYLGLKGDIRGWRPPCGQSKGYGNFMQKNRPGNERLGDLDDMLKIWRDILRRDPNVRKQVQGMFDHLLVDECQDLNTIQHQIFEYMSEHVTDGSDGKSIWMVGDDKQAIYQFRGAQPGLFQGLHGKEGWKTRMIRTNYRCEPEIVEAANRLISHNDDRIPMDAQANPNKPRGQASIKVELPDDNATAAIDVVGRVRRDMDEEGAKPEDYAVLARTNAELNDYETACIINEIPYVRKGGKGFLEAPESRAVLGYMDLASGTDFGSMQKSLCAAIAKPDRGLYLGPDGIEKAVKDTIENIARYERRDEKTVDPSSILTDRNYSRMLAEELKKPYKNKLTMKGDWLWNKVVTELSGQILDMGRDVAEVRALVNNPDATTEGLINHILDNVKSTTKTWNPGTRREDVTVTSLREDITTMLANFDANEGEDVVAEEETSPEVDSEGRPIKDEALDEEKKNQGIGAVKFLFALSAPNNNDHEQGLDPAKAGDFQKKLARYAKLRP
jgi:superfamily I DNA/RNA helicase